jgi:hypothetical protein
LNDFGCLSRDLAVLNLAKASIRKDAFGGVTSCMAASIRKDAFDGVTSCDEVAPGQQNPGTDRKALCC